MIIDGDDDVLRRGQYETDTDNDSHAVELLRLRGHDATAMRAAILRRTRWRCGGGGEGARHGDSRLDRLESRYFARDPRSTHTHWRARRRGLLRAAGWQRRRMDWSRYGWWCAVVISRTSLSLVGWLDTLDTLSFASRSLRHATRCLLAAGRSCGLRSRWCCCDWPSWWVCALGAGRNESSRAVASVQL